MSAADAKRHWEEDVAAMREGTRLYLSNEFSKAEELFQRGMVGRGESAMAVKSSKANEEPAEEDSAPADCDRIELRDTRGAFALQYAIVGLMRGVASLAADQLDECQRRLWEADALAALDTSWVGRKVVRGMCTLVAGLVQCLQREPVRGVWNIVRSWQWLRHLKTEALEYNGIGHEIVRSSALMSLGAFALILSLLPQHLIRAASWSTGFEIDRAAGLEMLRTCQREGGIYAPVAALGWLAFHVDTKTFLGEAQVTPTPTLALALPLTLTLTQTLTLPWRGAESRRALGVRRDPTRAHMHACILSAHACMHACIQSPEELSESAELLEWAAGHFHDSIFFAILQADLHACRQQVRVWVMVRVGVKVSHTAGRPARLQAAG